MDRLGHRNNAAAEEIAHQNTNDNGDEIEPNASLHHVADADASGTEDNGVRGCAHRHHKGTGRCKDRGKENRLRVEVQASRCRVDHRHHGCCQRRIGGDLRDEGDDCGDAKHHGQFADPFKDLSLSTDEGSDAG